MEQHAENGIDAATGDSAILSPKLGETESNAENTVASKGDSPYEQTEQNETAENTNVESADSYASQSDHHNDAEHPADECYANGVENGEDVSVSPSSPEEPDHTDDQPEITDTTEVKNDGPMEEELGDDPGPPEWLDILGNGLLKKKTKVQGAGVTTRPSAGCIVTVKTAGTLTENQATVDVNSELEFTLNDGDVILAWELAVALMELNEVATVDADAKYAYGATGREPDIPPNSRILYELELLDVKPKLDPADLSASERLHMADKKRESGNRYYSREEYTSAINSYNRAITILSADNQPEEDVSTLQEIVELRIKCYNNLAAAEIKAEAYQAAIDSCDCVLRHNAENVKALFRKGKALAGLAEYTRASEMLKRALAHDPASKVIHAELSRVRAQTRRKDAGQKELYSRMMSEHKGTKDPKDGANQKPWYMNRWMWYGSAAFAVIASAGIAFFKQMTQRAV